MAYAYAVEESAIWQDRFSLEQRTRARPKAGAKLLLFTRKAEEVLISGSSVITGVSGEYEDRATVTWAVGSVSRFDPPRQISELGGSLQKTRRFLEPWRDFKSWIVALSKQDFDTIVENAVALPRTVYRSLFHALPLALQAEFVRRYAELFPGRRARLDYDKLAPAILEYLEEALTDSWGMLDQFVRSYPVDIEDFPPIESLWLSAGHGDARLAAGAIRFGSDAVIVRRVLAPIATRVGEAESSLLEECRLQLGRARDEIERERRSWIDPIF